MGKHKDKIPGGLADDKKPKDFDSSKLKAGTKVELEHTSNKGVAREIAMDHLTEDKEYYKKLKEVEKGDRIDREADGKQELDYGKEELDKYKKKKSLKDRWSEMKKALDNNTAFFNLDEAIEDEDEEQPEEGSDEEMEEGAEPTESEGDEESQPEEEGGGDEMPEWLPEGMAVEGQDDSGGEEQQPEEGGDEEVGEDEQMQEIAQMLRDEGHSDAEIMHILHGHTVPQVDEAKRAKAEAEYAGIDRDQMMHEKEMQIREQEAGIELDHNKRMKDVEYERAQKESGLSDLEIEHAKKMKELEYQKAQAEAQVNDAQIKAQHAQRMLDLEYEVAKQQKQLELEYKKKEMEMKLKHADELAQAKHKEKMSMAKDDAKFKAEQKKADRAKEAKKMKKSDEESDDLNKVAGWSFNPKTHQFNHPEHGSVAVRPSQSGTGFEMVHGGKVVGHHADHGSLKAGLTEYMSSLSKPLVVRDKPANIAGTAAQPSTAVPKMPSDSPYTRENQVANAQRVREMDRKERSPVPNVSPDHKYQPIRNKGGQIMDLPEKRYANIRDKDVAPPVKKSEE